MDDRAEGYAAILRYYRERYRKLEDTEDGTYRFTSLGAWATSRAPHVYHFFRKIDLGRFRLFMDLGSGDGIVSCLAGLFTRSIGIEADPQLCLDAKTAVDRLGLADRVSFIRANYLTQNLRQADCLYRYPDRPIHDLEPLLEGWEGHLLLYGPHIPPRAMTPLRRLRCGRESLTAYAHSPQE